MAVHSKAHFKDILLIFFFFLAYGDSYKKIQDWTGLDDSTACTIFTWLFSMVEKLPHFVQTLTLRRRREFGQARERVNLFQPGAMIATIAFDGSQIRITGKGVSQNIVNYKSIKPNTKNETCVNIVFGTLMNGFWALISCPFPGRTLDMTVLQDQAEIRT